jgi:hypothetical protein
VPATDEALTGNNYVRPEGQNVGNFLTDRPSSRVLAAPGGDSQIVFGSDAASLDAPAKKVRGSSRLSTAAARSCTAAAVLPQGGAKYHA